MGFRVSKLILNKKDRWQGSNSYLIMKRSNFDYKKLNEDICKLLLLLRKHICGNNYIKNTLYQISLVSIV